MLLTRVTDVRILDLMEEIKLWLTAAKWSQAELARRTGLSTATISKFISGTRTVSRPFALAIEQATTEAFRSGEVAVAPLRAMDLLNRKAA